MKTSKLKEYLAVLMILSVIAITFVLLQHKVPSENNDVIMLIIGAMVGTVKDLYAYYFGSSEGSQRKTELMSKEHKDATTGGDTAIPVN